MNIVSTIVGLSIAGTAMPMMTQMSLAPVIAQKRAENFGIAEQKAVTYAAANEGKAEIADVPDGCSLSQEEAGAVSITCTEGVKQFVARVTRSFRSESELPGSFPYNPPASYTHYHCPHYDPWGVVAFNDTHLGGRNCVPIPLQSPAQFAQWDRADWLWDISGYGM